MERVSASFQTDYLFKRMSTQDKEMMLTAKRVHIKEPDVVGAQEVVATFMERTICPGKLSSLAASFSVSTESARALLPDDRQGDLQKHVTKLLGQATPNVYCLRVIVEEYLDKWRKRHGSVPVSGLPA
jgi:hypothetical protein